MKTSRRRFLTTSAATLSATAATGCAGKRERPDSIDAHVHVWGPNTVVYPLAEGYSEADLVPSSFTPEELFAQCRPHGVGRVVLIQMSFYGFDNSYMLDAMEQYHEFRGVAIIDETAPGVPGRMRELADQWVRGFRLYANREKAASWQDTPGMLEMWKTGAEENLAMCLLADPDALPAARAMCERFPETPVVIDHFARIGMRGPVDRKELDLLLSFADFPKVHLKTSAFYALGKKAAPYTDLGPMIRELRDAFGANRLMWATDCPYQVMDGHTYGDSIALIRDRLDFLSEEDKAWMLRGTAEEVFFKSR